MYPYKVSFIIPCFNESGNINRIYEKIGGSFKDCPFQIVFVDDGSKDSTFQEIKDLENEDNIIGISFSRNFGKEAAMLAGLKESKGEYTTFIDADLQQDPAEGLHR